MLALSLRAASRAQLSPRPLYNKAKNLAYDAKFDKTGFGIFRMQVSVRKNLKTSTQNMIFASLIKNI